MESTSGMANAQSIFHQRSTIPLRDECRWQYLQPSAAATFGYQHAYLMAHWNKTYVIIVFSYELLLTTNT